MSAHLLSPAIDHVGQSLRQAASGAGFDPVLAAAAALESAAMDAGHALLAGAAICLQQRVPLLAASPDAEADCSGLADSWCEHAPHLLAEPGSPALENAWLALQDLLALPTEQSPAEDYVAPSAAPSPAHADSAPALGEADAAADFLSDMPAEFAPPPAPTAADAAADFLSDQPAAPIPTAPVAPVAAGRRTRARSRAAARPTPSPGPATLLSPPPPSRPPHEESAVEDEVPPEMIEIFNLEATEGFLDMERSILAWEKAPDSRNDLHNVYRLAHSVKGAANAVGIRAVGRVLHRLEDLLEDRMEGRSTLAPAVVTQLVLGVVDQLRTALTAQAVITPEWKTEADALVARIDSARAGVPAVPAGPATLLSPPTPSPGPATLLSPPAPAPAPAPAAPAPAKEHGSVRVDARELDGLMNLVGDLIINRNRLNAKLAQVVSLRSELGRARERLLGVVDDFNDRNEFTTRSAKSAPAAGLAGKFSENELDRYDDFNLLSRSLVEIAADAEQVIVQIDEQFGSFSEETVSFTAVTRRLQEEVARVRMVPIDLLYRRLQRSVRDAAQSEAKTVDYHAEGGDTRIDKLISDAIYSPLLHLVRNAVAHGIETPAARLAAGKPAAGRLSIRSRAEAGRVVLEIADDGAGLDRARILAKARQRGLLKPGAPDPEDSAITEFIFLSGFSTAAATTDVAGRGVGLDVVRTELARLGGTVAVESVPGRGATFLVTLPLTLAINQAMLVETAGRVYALPFNFVERVLEAPPSAINRAGDEDLLVLPGLAPLPVLRLDQRLGWPSTGAGATAVVVRVGDQRRAVIVDKIRSKLDIVVKPLGPILGRHPSFTGATLGSDGGVVFILDVPALVSGRRAAGPAAAALATAAASGAARILVVDDSLSIRRIVSLHLENAGYTVDTAIDGAEALEKLRAATYAMVFSDLEMPRINGFELCGEIRRQPALAALPVVILTSRDAAKHRTHAAEAGATDYLIKPAGREQIVELARRYAGQVSG